MFLIKVYPNTNSTTPIVINSHAVNITINDNIDEYAECNFTIPLKEAPTGSLKLLEYQRVEILETNNNLPYTVLFDGFIFNITIDLNELKVLARNNKYLLYKKMKIGNTTYTGDSAATIMNSILSTWNATYSESWTFETTIGTTFGSVTFKDGDNWFNILETLAGIKNAKFRVEGTNIIFQETIGTDKTSGSEFVELVYTGGLSNENNIAGVTLKSLSSIANVVYGASPSFSRILRTDPTSVTQFGALGVYVSFRDADRTTQTEQYLARSKDQQNLYEVEVETILDRTGQTSEQETQNNKLANLEMGDKIKLRVENTSDYLDIDASVFVITKSLQIANDTKIVKVGVSQAYTIFDDLYFRLRQQEDNTLINSL